MVVRAHSSIAFLMVVVFLVAVDFAVVVAWPGVGAPWFAVAVTTLPTINLLLLALPRLSRRDARPYWAGFEAVGWSAVLLSAFFGWFHQVAFFSPIARLDRLDLFTARPHIEFGFLVLIAAVLYTIPQMLAAWIGGWLSAKYQIVRRRP